MQSFQYIQDHFYSTRFRNTQWRIVYVVMSLQFQCFVTLRGEAVTWNTTNSALFVFFFFFFVLLKESRHDFATFWNVNYVAYWLEENRITCFNVRKNIWNNARHCSTLFPGCLKRSISPKPLLPTRHESSDLPAELLRCDWPKASWMCRGKRDGP